MKVVLFSCSQAYVIKGSARRYLVRLCAFAFDIALLECDAL
ncbi:hypothetical protein F0Z19_0629 [Vibrio cyclitrophicus]|nr:hypothetical protein F0Z19_0629 [Vibrio cyclitrophicus]